jgi:hypothetical protein
MRPHALFTVAALAAALPAAAQQQKVTGPVAQYWVSAETAAGMNMGTGMGAMGGMMGRMMGLGGGDGGKRMLLQLGSTQAATGDPRAQHDLPPGVGMGPSLPLLTPKVERAAPREPGELPQGMERPKGRMLIFWGCGAQARAGQPVIIDFAKLAQGQVPSGFAARRVNVPNPPMFGRTRGYGDWPNAEDSRAVPANASLRGDHVVKGNYSPEIRFSVDRHDFMAPVALTAQRTPEGATSVRWNGIDGATGYFAMATGSNGEDLVFWSSSEQQDMGGQLMDYVPPAEVARLVREKVVLAPQVTECTVPAEVVKAAPAAFMSFVAYGDELNVVHPPRPQDVAKTWEQLYTVKVRLKSTGSLLLSEGGMAQGRGASRGAQAPGGVPPTSDAQQPPGQANPAAPANPVEQGIGILRGILGR